MENIKIKKKAADINFSFQDRKGGKLSIKPSSFYQLSHSSKNKALLIIQNNKSFEGIALLSDIPQLVRFSVRNFYKFVNCFIYLERGNCLSFKFSVYIIFILSVVICGAEDLLCFGRVRFQKKNVDKF